MAGEDSQKRPLESQPAAVLKSHCQMVKPGWSVGVGAVGGGNHLYECEPDFVICVLRGLFCFVRVVMYERRGPGDMPGKGRQTLKNIKHAEIKVNIPGFLHRH